MPKARAAGMLRAAGTSAWCMRVAAAIGSVIFQMPAASITPASETAEMTERMVFQAGTSQEPTRRERYAILSSMFAILLLFWGLAEAPAADMVVTNADIYTVDAAQPRARALAVRGHRLLAVGDDVSEHIGPNTKCVDAHGATVVPGFSLEILDLRRTRSAGEVIAMVRRAAASLPAGTWIRGRGWDQTRWPGTAFPDAGELSRASPDHPVLLSRVDGHAAWVNQRALALAGITAATPDPPGGRILRDGSGRPTGILIDRAQELVRAKIPPPSQDQVREQGARGAGVRPARPDRRS